MAKDADDSRAPKIEELVTELDPQVPRLTIKLPEGRATDGRRHDRRHGGHDIRRADHPRSRPAHDRVPVASGHEEEQGRPRRARRQLRGHARRPEAATTKADTTPRRHRPPPAEARADAPPDPAAATGSAAYGIGGAGVVAIGSRAPDAVRAQQVQRRARGALRRHDEQLRRRRPHADARRAPQGEPRDDRVLGRPRGGRRRRRALPARAEGPHGEKPEDAALYVVPSISPTAPASWSAATCCRADATSYFGGAAGRAGVAASLRPTPLSLPAAPIALPADPVSLPAALPAARAAGRPPAPCLHHGLVHLRTAGPATACRSRPARRPRSSRRPCT